MKQKKITFTLVFAVLVITSTSYAWGFCGYFQEDPDRVYTCDPDAQNQGYQRHSRGYHGMIYGRYGMRQANRGMGIYSWLTTDQQNKLNTLRQKFIDETAATRAKLMKEQQKLRNEMTSSVPDRNKIKLLVKKISGLRETLMEKRIDFRLDARKIAPFIGKTNRNHGYRGRMYKRGMARAF